jgi:hypothetical protein
MARLGWRSGSAAVLVGTVVLSASAFGQEIPTPVPPSLKPAITEIEADWVDGRIKLKAEVVPRGAKVAKVTFRYRGKRFTAIKVGQWRYAKRVKPRGGDGRGDEVRFKVRACTATVCGERTDSDRAGPPTQAKRR